MFWRRKINHRELKKLIAVAKGEAPADLLLAHAKIINTFTAEVEPGNVAIFDGIIAGVGDYYEARQVIDLEGKFVIPGLINGHTHIESSLLHVGRYAEAVVPHGTCAVVTDLHEIANVCGIGGIKYIMSCARSLPLDIFLMVPSCVPATKLETSGAQLSADSVQAYLGKENVLGLGEVMDFPAVLSGDREMLLKISLCKGKVIDGHAPGLKGKALEAYLAAGILSDHESTTLKEAEEKLKRGMYLMIREGSSAKNLDALLPAVSDQTYPRCLFVVDDRSCVDLFNDGDIDAVVRKAIGRGLDPVRAIQLATINPAVYFGLHRFGAVAPGYIANLMVIDDLAAFNIEMVFHHGQLVAKEGKPLFSVDIPKDEDLAHTVNIRPFNIEALRMAACEKVYPIIEVIPGQIVTKKRIEEMKSEGGFIVSDVDRDILKLVVVERHRASGNLGLGLVKGFGLKTGAMATSFAHDSHNIVAVGTNDEDILMAIKGIERLEGGLVLTSGGEILDSLPLPIAGLLSTEPLEVVVNKLENLERTTISLGCSLPSPFAVLSFLALPVIPELRLTDLGLVEVD